MIHLRALGRLDLRRDDEPVLELQGRPKLLALLAYLVLARTDGEHRRDALVALFWPDADAKRARTSLRGALFYLRRALGPLVIESAADLVRVDFTAITCDALTVEQALDDGRRDAAVASYGGALLDGVYVTDAPDVERWMDARRARLHARVVDAAAALADVALAQGSLVDARRWSARAVELAPPDLAHTRRLGALMARDGDRAGVLALAAEWERSYRDVNGESAPVTARAIADSLLSADTSEPAPPALAAVPAQGRDRRRRRWPVVAMLGAALVLAGAVAAARGAAGDVARELDALVRGRAPAVGHAPTGDVTSNAASAFFEGERRMRSGRIAPAVEAFTQAVTLDSSFALASYRLSIAASWNGQDDLSRAAIDAALRHAERLNADELLLAQGQRNYLNAEPDSALTRFRSVLARRPEQLEGWLQLGEIGFHYGPSLGLPPDSAEAWFAHALTLSPDDASALLHLLRLRARHGARGAIDSIAARAMQLGPDVRRTLEVQALSAAVHDDAAALQRVAADPLLATDFGLVMAPMIASATLRFDAAALLARRVLVGRTGSQNGLTLQTRMLLAQLALAAGHRDEFERQRQSVALETRARALELDARRAILPGSGTPPHEIAMLLAALDVATPNDENVGPSREQLQLQGIYPPRRAWLRAMLRVQAGDTAGARRLGDSLATWPSRNVGNRDFGATYAQVVRAALLLRSGRPAEALAMLGMPRLQPDHTLPDIMSAPKAHERWLRIVALSALGRDAEARAWAAGFPDPQGYDVAYVPAVRAWLERHGSVPR